MDTIDQIYNGCAMLPGLYKLPEDRAWMVLDPMQRHRLRTSMHRIRVALGELPQVGTAMEEAADAYVAGYEDADK